MVNLILCGGSGTRLWPVSRALLPKQFVKIMHNRSLFQDTVERNASLCEEQFIVSNTEHYFLALDQLEELGKTQNRYLLEPVGKNTAPAIAMACMAMEEETVVLVTPSDHLIKDGSRYEAAVTEARKRAQEGSLVTFGITPTEPETGYGYIEARSDGEVTRFHEKPDLKQAQKYIGEGNCYWNSGMFCFKAGVFLKELQRYAPEIFSAAQQAFAGRICNGHMRIRLEDMEKIPSKSIDHAVMEHSKKVKMVAGDFGWSDMGSFDSLYEELPKDENGNTESPRHIAVDSKNNFIYAKERIVATVDMEDTIVVDTGDAVLVGKKGSGQKVKKVVEKLKERDSQLHNVHRTAHRPWGTFTVLEDTSGYKIKRIEVKPGKRLSLQKHFHRNEHWIVVSGTATVTIGEETKLLRPNESTYIKMGQQHRLANYGKIPVVMIEAQVGEYIAEDDIERLHDDYERKEKSR